MQHDTSFDRIRVENPYERPSICVEYKNLGKNFDQLIEAFAGYVVKTCRDF
jgi:hypothetical protein